MAMETFLIAMKKHGSREDTARVISVVNALGGRIDIVIEGSGTIIATFDNTLADRIRRLPYVKLVGGISIGQRRILRHRH
ncbi:MAG: hypothetical protein ACQETG_02310 [Thermodesulfobacteriota bacterium]